MKLSKKPDGGIVVAAALDVDHDAGPRSGALPAFDAANAGIEQVGEVIPVVG